jgi:hypothetical protein
MIIPLIELFWRVKSHWSLPASSAMPLAGRQLLVSEDKTDITLIPTINPDGFDRATEASCYGKDGLDQQTIHEHTAGNFEWC